MIWMDNFSKTLARQCPSLAKGVYSSCLWTGVAVFSDPELDGMDVTVRRDAHAGPCRARHARQSHPTTTDSSLQKKKET